MWETVEGPPLMDEDRHAICQVICRGVEGAELENLCYKDAEMHKTIKLEKRGISKKAKALWPRNGEAYYDRSGERHMEEPR